MATSDLYDFLVIGAGPVGSYLASQLAAFGFRTLVVDKRSRLGEPVCCTGLVSRECVNTFAFPPSIVLREVYGARIFSPSGKLIELTRPEVQAIVLDRGALDLELAKQAAAAGADYMLSSIAQSIEVTSEAVRLKLNSNGSSCTVMGKYLIVATGFGSKLLNYVGLNGVRDFAIGAQSEVRSPIEEIEVYTGSKIAPGFFAWLVPTHPGRALLGLLSRSQPRQRLRMLATRLKQEGRIDSLPDVILSRGVSLKALHRTSRGRILVVGDAAGQVKPTTGGGIFFGLISASIAAKAMAETPSNHEKGVSNYEHEWRHRLGRELKIGHIARVVYEHLSDNQLDHAFNIMNSTGLTHRLIESTDIEFDWHGRAIRHLLRESPRACLSALWPGHI